MADLKPLIRHRKHLVEEKQRVLGELYRRVEELGGQKEDWLEAIDREIQLTEEMQDLYAQTQLGKYLDGARKKIDLLDDAIKAVNERIAVAQEDVRAAFADMKKVEIIQERREAEEQAAIDKKESELMDDIGIDGFLRKKKQSEE